MTGGAGAIAEVRRQGARAGRVVRGVEEHARARSPARNHSSRAGQLHRGETVLDGCLVTGRPLAAANGLEQTDRDERVAGLVLAAERQAARDRSVATGVVTVSVDVPSSHRRVDSRTRHSTRVTGAPAAAPLSSMARQASSGTSPTTSGTPGLAMPAFSTAIAAERSAQVPLVVEADGRDGAGDRRDDVGGVEAAAEPDFDDGHIDAGVARNSSKAAAVVDLEERRQGRQRARRHAAGRPPRTRAPSAAESTAVVDGLAVDARSAPRGGRGAATCSGRSRGPAPRSARSVIAVTEPLPLVPATWSDGQARVRGGRARRSSDAHGRRGPA